MQRADTDVKEKVRQKMGKRVLNNLGLKLISVVLAVVVWFLVVMINNPKDSVTFSGINVNLINTELLDKENKIYEIKDNSNKVRVTVEAPKNVIDQLRASDIVAEADVSRLTEVNTIAINCSVLNSAVQISSVTSTPDLLSLSVEDKAKKWVSVECRTVGEVAEGYMVDSIKSDQTRMEVGGPESVVDQIDHAGLEMDVSGATENVSGNVDIRFYNKDGVRIDDSRIDKNADSMNVEARVLAVKEVPIELNYTGVPAEGYLATGQVVCEPSTVRIAGTASALADISKISIAERELDITDESSNVVKDINIKRYLDSGVSLADKEFSGKVTATVGIEARAERTLMISESNISVRNLPEGFESSLAGGQGASFRLRISGLSAVVSAIDQNTVQGTVDVGEWMRGRNLTDLDAGIYEIPINFAFEEDITIENTVYASVNIVWQGQDEDQNHNGAEGD